MISRKEAGGYSLDFVGLNLVGKLLGHRQSRTTERIAAMMEGSRPPK
jgi:hypothetical protein